MRMLARGAWIGTLALAIFGFSQANAAEPGPASGQLTCFHRSACCYEPTTCCSPSCPCHRHRGPIRRFLHRLFHRHDCCPPAAVPVIPEVPVAVPPPPVQFLPPAGGPAVAPPTAPPLPPPGSSIPPAVGSSYHQPSTAAPPVRFERLASYRR